MKDNQPTTQDWASMTQTLKILFPQNTAALGTSFLKAYFESFPQKQCDILLKKYFTPTPLANN